MASKRVPAPPPYLRPYHEAHARRARGHRTLLYDVPGDQTLGFEALVRNCPLSGLDLLDAGCGRADLLGYLRERRIFPASYTGLEALPWLVRAARRKGYDECRIVEVDFVKEPASFQAGADVVAFNGSLNLLSPGQFYRTLEAAWAGTERWLAFNFLCSPALAAADWLTWHDRRDVIAWARQRSSAVTVDDRYIEGDCTIVMAKP